MKKTTTMLFGLAFVSAATAEVPTATSHPKGALEETVAAIRRLRALPNDVFTSRPIEDVAKRRLLYRLDRSHLPEAARRLVGKLDAHEGLDFEILMEWARLDPKATFEYLRKFDEKWFDCVLGNELFERWAGFDADAALAAARSIGNKERVYDVLAVIAVDSPSRALELMPHTQSPQYGFARDVLAYWAATDADKATRWVLAQPKHDSLLWNLAFVKAEMNRPKTREWALTLRGDDKTHALAGMISECITDRGGKTQDAEMASKEFLEFFPDSQLNQDNFANQAEKVLADAVADAWTKAGRSADGMTWIQRLKPSQGRDELHAQLVANWSAKSPSEAIKYLSALGAGRTLDRALIYSATNLSRIDPAGVFRLAQTSSDDSLRHSMLIQCFRLWLQIAPRNAVSALDKLPKEESMKIESAISESAKTPPRRTF